MKDLRWVALCVAAACSARCSSSDSTLPLADAGSRPDAPAGTDARPLDDATSTGGDARPDTGSTDPDAGIGDAPPSDQGAPDTGAPDGGPPDSSPGDRGPIDVGTIPIGTPITAPNRTWTWVDFPDSHCDDGSTTGIGVNLSDTTTNTIFFLDGGGACWDYVTCFVIGTAQRGPFGQAQFEARSRSLRNSIFDRTVAENPFKDWNQVFIPYCTGDVHGGNNVAMYSNGTTTRTYNHVGRRNMNAFLGRLYPTFPSPGKLVVSGSSAGGFGAAFNYVAVRSLWTTGQVYLLDDSGPALAGDAVPAALRDAWYSSWHIQEVLDAICGGTSCRTDFSLATTIIARNFPNDRFALLSSLQDQTIRTYFMRSPAAFQAALLMTAHDVLDPLPNFKYFFTPGEQHTMLGGPASHTSRTTNLWDWLTQQVTDDPAWSSTSPQ